LMLVEGVGEEGHSAHSMATKPSVAQDLNDKCTEFMTGVKAGAMAMDHPFIKPICLGLIEDCAADRSAGEGVGLPRFNRKSMIENMCLAVYSMISHSDPSKELCDITVECVNTLALPALPERCASAEAALLQAPSTALSQGDQS